MLKDLLVELIHRHVVQRPARKAESVAWSISSWLCECYSPRHREMSYSHETCTPLCADTAVALSDLLDLGVFELVLDFTAVTSALVFHGLAVEAQV